MLVVRKEQMEALAQAQLENQIVDHLYEFFPEQCETLGQLEVCKIVRYGFERAESYGIVADGDVCQYIDVMMVFGRDFDTDPELAWGGAILNDESIKDPSIRIEWLCDAAMEHLDEATEDDATEEV